MQTLGYFLLLALYPFVLAVMLPLRGIFYVITKVLDFQEAQNVPSW